MANTEDIGGVSIGVDADFSGLEAQFQEAIGKAVAAGQSLSDALASAVKAPDFSGISGSVDQLEAKWQELGADIAKALGITLPTPDVSGVTGAIGQIETAVHEAAASTGEITSALNSVGSAAGSAAPNIESAAKSTQDLQQAAGAAAPSFGELASQLAKLGGIALTAQGMLSLAESIGEALDSITRAQISLTALTGSAQQADEMLQRLDQIGVSDGLSIPALQQAVVRMQELLPEGSDVVGILGQIADSAAVMGTSLETAANKFSLIADSGKASDKSLASLGLSMRDLQQAMQDAGVSAALLGEGAKQAFADLDQHDRIVVLQTALEKFQGVAQDIADNTFSGAWHKAIAQWDTDLGIMQKDLTDAGNSFGSLTPIVNAVAAAITVAITGIRGTVDVLVGSVAIAQSALMGIGSAVKDAFSGNIQGAVNDIKGAMADMAAASKAQGDALKADLGGGLKTVTDLMNQTAAATKPTKDALDGLGNSAKTSAEKLVQLAQATHDFTDQAMAAINAFGGAARDAASVMDALASNVDRLQTSVAHAQGNLNNAVQALEDLKAKSDGSAASLGDIEQAENRVATASAKLETAQKNLVAAQQALDDKWGIAQTAAAAMNEAMSQAGGAILTAEDNLRDLGVSFDTTLPKISPLNKAMGDLGININNLDTPIKTLHADFADLENALDKAASRASQTGDWDGYISALEKFDGFVTKLGKTDLPQMTQVLGDNIAKMGQGGAPITAIVTELGKYQSAINKLAQQDLPDAIAAQQRFIDLLTNSGASTGQILRSMADLDQMMIKYGEDTGTSSAQAVLSLEGIRIKQQELALSSHGYADEMVKGIHDIISGFDSLAGSMADAIVNGKNLGDALVQSFKKIGQSLLTDVLQAGMIPLKQAMLEVLGSLMPSLNLGLKVTQASASALTDAMAAQASAVNAVVSADIAATGAKTANTAATTASTGATVADTGATVAGTGATIAATTATIADTTATIADTTAEIADTAATIANTAAQIALTSAIGAVAGVIGAIAGVIGDIYLAAIDTKLFHIETSLLAIQNDTANRRKDAWDQHNEMYGRVGEIMNAVYAMRDSLIQLVGGGLGSGNTAQVGADLDSTANSLIDLVTLSRSMVSHFDTLDRDFNAGLQDIEGGMQSIYTELVTINDSIRGVAQQTASSSQALVEAMSESTQSGTANAHAIKSALDSIDANTGRGNNTLGQIATAAQTAAAQTAAAASAAQDVAGQLTALQNEYAFYGKLINDAVRAGDLSLAATYQQTQAAIGRQIQSLEEGQTNLMNAEDGWQDAIRQDLSGISYGVTAAGGSIVNAVTAGANQITAAVQNVAQAIDAFGNKVGGGTGTAGAPNPGQNELQPSGGVSSAGYVNPGAGPLGSTSGGPGTPKSNSNAPPTNTGVFPSPDQLTFVPTTGSQGIITPGTGAGVGGGSSSGGLSDSNGAPRSKAPFVPDDLGAGVQQAISGALQDAITGAAQAVTGGDLIGTGSTGKAIPQGGQAETVPYSEPQTRTLAGPAPFQSPDEKAAADAAIVKAIGDQLLALQTQLQQSIANTGANSVTSRELQNQIDQLTGSKSKQPDFGPSFVPPASAGATVPSGSGAGPSTISFGSTPSIGPPAEVKLTPVSIDALINAGPKINLDALKDIPKIGPPVVDAVKAAQDAVTAATTALADAVNSGDIKKIESANTTLVTDNQILAQAKSDAAAAAKIQAEIAKGIQDAKDAIYKALTDLNNATAKGDTAKIALAETALGVATKQLATAQAQNVEMQTAADKIASSVKALAPHIDNAKFGQPTYNGGNTPTGTGTLGYGALNPYGNFATQQSVASHGNPTFDPAKFASQESASNGTPTFDPAKFGAPSFDVGGLVPSDMLALVHQGEAILPPDLTAMLRRVASTPADMRAAATQNITVNSTIHVHGVKDGRELAKTFAKHLKQVIPFGGMQS